MSRSEILNKIDCERSKQLELPDSEIDLQNTPNDWAAIVGHYLFGDVRRGRNAPSREAFEDSMIKAAAIIVAALESTDAMQALDHFSDKPTEEMNRFAATLSDVATTRKT